MLPIGDGGSNASSRRADDRPGAAIHRKKGSEESALTAGSDTSSEDVDASVRRMGSPMEVMSDVVGKFAIASVVV